MPKIDTRQFYYSALKRYGTTPQALHWIDHNRQTIRFRQILHALPKDLASTTLVDAGCGFGDFYLFLQKNDKQPSKYVGIDILEKFTRIAKKRTNTTVICADILRDPLIRADWYICSGTLNTLTYFETHLFLQRCIEYASCGVVFNFLCADKESDVYNYITEKAMLQLLRHYKTEIFFISKGYLPNDMTIAIRKTNKKA